MLNKSEIALASDIKDLNQRFRRVSTSLHQDLIDVDDTSTSNNNNYIQNYNKNIAS